LIVDLKPESHQLSLFREELLRDIDIGVFDHTIAAFWYFLILSEMLLALKRDLDARGRYDNRALANAIEIDGHIERLRINESGDFTSRLAALCSNLLNQIRHLAEEGKKFGPQQLTNIIFEGGITSIRGAIEKYTNSDTELVFFVRQHRQGMASKWCSQS
jgi:hypothetical protein